MVRACLRLGAKEVRASVKASCGKRKPCRRALRRLVAEQRQALRACTNATRR
jgi:hypothetical protein